MQKLFPPLLKAVQTGLTEVFDRGMPIDKFLLTIRREKKFGSRDRSFVATQLYDITRYRRLITFIADEASTKTVPLTWQWVIINHLRKGIEVDASGILKEGASELLDKWTIRLQQIDEPAILTSFNDWMWEMGTSDYGTEWLEMAKSLNEEANVFLRVNTLKQDNVRVCERLKKDDFFVATVPNTDAIILKERSNALKNHPLYQKGVFEFQDLASQHVSIMSGVEPGMMVIDACAGAGGKTLHLAALMQNRGHLIAADKYPERMKQMDYRAKRAGVSNIEKSSVVALMDFKEAAEVVLLDVPCSASGTLQRKPELKWKITSRQLDALIEEQKDILNYHQQLVKPGGALVYATCSIFHCEGEIQMKDFLAAHTNFKLEVERRFLPNKDGTDGFYIAVLRKM